MLAKKIAISAALILSIAGSGLGSISAHASNVQDTYWHNEYRLWDQNDNTPSRQKYDTTSYYNRTDNISGYNNYIRIWAALADGTAVNQDHAYNTYEGQVLYLWNLAVERYGSGVSVRINSTSTKWLSASGVWSPDSV